MQVGPHVFGDGRLGVWVIENAGLTDKLKHVLPRLQNAAPITDVFLPGGKSNKTHRDLVKTYGFFPAVYTSPLVGDTGEEYGARSLAQLDATGASVLELNIEIPDGAIKGFTSATVLYIRKRRAFLRLRVNIAPFKAQFLPVELFQGDPHLFAIEQAYRGNMDSLVPAEHCLRNLTDWGIPPEKASVMHAAHCSLRPGLPRVPVLPTFDRYRGSIYSDDLLLNAGLLSSS